MAASTEDASESKFSEEISKLMGQGKRHLICSEVLEAVKCFEEATHKLDEKYGSRADECGEAYLFYGKALLELAREENGVLGNAIKEGADAKGEESSDDDEEEQEEEQTGAAEPKSGESSNENEEQMDTVGPKISEMSPETKDKIRKDVQDAFDIAKKENDDIRHKIQEDEQEATTEKKEGEAEVKDKKGKDQDENKEEKQDKDEEATNENKTESETKSADTTPTDKTAETKEGDKASEKEEKESKEVLEGAESAAAGKEEGKEAEEGAKEGTEEGKEGEEDKTEGEEEDMEADDGEGDGEGNADDQGEDDAGGDAAEGQEEDADIPTMQGAWESLELARIVFSRHDTKEAQLNLAEVHLKLGEINLEQEQFVNAAEEFQKCLDLQLKHLEPDDRLIAETAYNMGLAYSFQQNYFKAKEFFSKALDVIKLKTTKLEARIAEWESKSKGKGKATDDNPCVKDRKELEELQNLFPEIKARVDDAQEMINSTPTQPESTTEEGFKSSGLATSDAPASTIPVKQPATLIPVRRKRTNPEDESGSAEVQDTGAPVKKPRQEDNQPAAPVITENGHVPNGGVTSAEQK